MIGVPQHGPGAEQLVQRQPAVEDVAADQTRPRLELVWRETGGPPVKTPDRKGFGSRLIERNVRHDLAGEIELDYASGGLTATFSIPLDREQGT